MFLCPESNVNDVAEFHISKSLLMTIIFYSEAERTAAGHQGLELDSLDLKD